MTQQDVFFIVLVIASATLSCVVANLYTINKNLNIKIKNILTFSKGDKVLYNTGSVSYNSKTDVAYVEAIITETTETKVKLSVTNINGISSDSNVFNTTQDKTMLFNFTNNKWVDKDSVKILISDYDHRNRKISNILNE
jgi:hypothetical protein